MPILKNARHERFAAGLADGLSQEKAYTGAGFSPKGARGSASSLLKQHSYILKRRDEILIEREKLHAMSTTKACEALAIDKEWVLNQLIDNVFKAKRGEPVLNKEGEITGYRPNFGAANAALALIGKEFGMFLGNKEPEGPEPYRDIEELKERVRQRSIKLGLVFPEMCLKRYE
ncbi:hypothetical protein SAMN05216404_103302 [Nitrosospira multiformis]|uniref:Terminase small subunit n=1 Tax=Nitrosospira multiformis TaxID=1231 RepID=A0A1H8FDN5_9PROT|nr:hypothetical protein [Nitrosospira multiformis]SEN29913.1 hypothetical protein SAMN05216404_103302 [Nitrosospira multiformis]